MRIRIFALFLCAGILTALCACGTQAPPPVTTTTTPAAMQTPAPTEPPTTTVAPITTLPYLEDIFEKDFWGTFTHKDKQGYEMTGEITIWKSEIIKDTAALHPADNSKRISADGTEKQALPFLYTLTYQSDGFPCEMKAVITNLCYSISRALSDVYFWNREDYLNSSINSALKESVWQKSVSSKGETLTIAGYYLIPVNRTPIYPDSAPLDDAASFTFQCFFAEGHSNPSFSIPIQQQYGDKIHINEEAFNYATSTYYNVNQFADYKFF